MPIASPRTWWRLPSANEARREQQRTADHPAERLDEEGVEQERGGEQADGLPVGRVAELDVLAGLLLADPAARDVEGVQGRHHEEGGADDEGQRLRADRVVAARRGTDPGGVPDDDQPDQGQGRAQAVLRAVPDPAGSRGGLGGHARPRVCRSWATLVSCVLEERAELVAGGEGVDPAALLQLGLPRRGLVHLGEGVDPDLLVLLGEAGGRHDATPVGELEVDALLLEGRHVLERLDPLGARHGEDADVAGLDLVEELTEARGAEGDLVAEQRRQQLAATVVRHVAHGLGVDADGLGELHRQQVVGAARRGAAADREALRVLLPGLDQLVDVGVGGVLGHDDRPGLLDQLGDGGGLVQRGLRLLGVGGAEHAQAHLHGQLAVALLVDDALEADGATGARAG